MSLSEGNMTLLEVQRAAQKIKTELTTQIKNMNAQEKDSPPTSLTLRPPKKNKK
jgi:hypothetical protein